MLVVVAGAGNLGQHLIEFFDKQQVSLILIEENEQRLARIKSQHDIMVVKGDMLSHYVLRRANVAACDLFIACSGIDSSNIVSSQLAKRLGARYSVARIYSENIFPFENNDLEEYFGVDWLVSPSLLTGYRLANQFFEEEAFSFDNYFSAQINVFRIRISSESACLKKTPEKILKSFKSNGTQLVAIYRNGNTIDPFSQKDWSFKEGDHVILMSKRRDDFDFFKDFYTSKYLNQKIYIAGVSPTIFTMLSIMVTKNDQSKVTIFENDLDTCKSIMEKYNVKTINLDPADFDEIKKLEPDLGGIFICASENDANNLTYALNAQQMGFKYIVPLVNEFDKMGLFKYFPSFKILSPPELSAIEIHRYFNQEILSNFELVRGSHIRAVVKTVEKNSKWLGKNLKELTNEPFFRVLCTWKEEGLEIYHPGDDVIVNEGNKLLVASFSGEKDDSLQKILSV
ncbi:trk system potassium uptake protein TrkA-like [Ylistrum balloti]|uniref:trk system potassium uptake protein TrkA-like n=1 Tax=Ylistrum balloti TaxID=509963 RepID=UPI002905B420|nr:trk system potassium uptake protein TrkA-like [Ylistrum balloti]